MRYIEVIWYDRENGEEELQSNDPVPVIICGYKPVHAGKSRKRLFIRQEGSFIVKGIRPN